MRFSKLVRARYIYGLAMGVGLLGLLPGGVRASVTNVFAVKNSLQAAGINESGARVATFKGSSGALLGTNTSAAVAVAIHDMDCTPTGVHPRIRVVAYDRATQKVLGTLIDFSTTAEVYSGDDQIIMNAQGIGGSAAEGANVDALITLRYQPCTATNAPTRPTGIVIQPLGSFKPTGTPGFQAPITDDEGVVLFLTEDPNHPVLPVGVGGIATAPSPNCNIDLNVNALSFGTIVVNSNSVQTLHIRNNGTLPCSISAITVNGSSAFTFPPLTFPVAVPPGTGVSLPVTFLPITNGADSAVLRVTSSDPNDPQQFVNLSGTGTATTPCDINVSPLLLNFGSVELGTNRTLSVTVTNTGGEGCFVDLLTLVTRSTEFSYSPAGAFTVGPGTSQVIAVTYTPTVAVAATGTLEIDSNDSDERLILVGLTGAGVEAECRLAIGPTSLDFGAVILGNSRALTVGITNVGLAICTITTNTLSGSTDFTLDPPVTTPLDLAPGDIAEFVFVYTPSATGNVTGAVVIGGVTPTTISFQGLGVIGTADCSFNFSRTAIDFGEVAVGSPEVQKFQISNTGLTNCTIQSITHSGSLTFTTNGLVPPLPINLAAGESVEIGVRYLPVAPGASVGQLQVITDDELQPITDIPLNGFGVQVVLAVSTNTLDFGALPVGDMTSLSVFLTNTSTVNAIINSISKSGSGDFILDPIVPTSQFILSPNHFVEIAITYLPSNQGSDAGTVNVNGNQAGSPTAIQLTGLGLRCNLTVSPSTLPFGRVPINTTNSLTVTVNNTGNTNCLVDAVEVLGSGRYFVTEPAVPFDVAPGQPVTVTVDYLPVNIQTVLILGGTLKSSGTPTIVTP